MPSLNEKLRVLYEWSPLIGMVSEISAAVTPLDRAVKVSATLRWLARKTDTPVDDELIVLLESILKTPEGQALFGYMVKLSTSLSQAEVGP